MNKHKNHEKHEEHCASVTRLLLSDPPQIPPCDCKLSKVQSHVKYDNQVTVDGGYLLSLMKNSLFLECLDACGVNDFERYDDAVEMYYTDSKEDEDECKEYGV
jgi:hypothetical protein